MFWNVIFFILFLICVVLTLFDLYKIHHFKMTTIIKKCNNHKYDDKDSSRVIDCIDKNHGYGCRNVTVLSHQPDFIYWLIFIVPFVIFLTFAIPITAVQYQASNDVNNSFYVVEELAIQRDAILNEFDEILDNEDFVQLMNAAVPEDVKFLRNNPEVTGFLLGRADRIVEINSRLFEERNRILAQSKSVCNYSGNPLIPMIPFMRPNCSLGTVLEITSVNIAEEE